MSARGLAPARIATLACRTVAVAYFVVALVWGARQLGTFPRYGDSVEYFRLASTLEVDAYRGIAYPALLGAAQRLALPAGFPEPLCRDMGTETESCTFPAPLVAVQVLQVALAVASLLYFCHLVLPAAGLGGSRLIVSPTVAGLAVAAAIALDPLLLHFDLAFMADSLALTASLFLCGSLAILLTRGFAWQPALLCLGSCFLLTNLRVEKRWLVAFLVAGVLARLLWQGRGERSARLLRPALPAVALVALALSAGVAVSRIYSTPGQRWPPEESWLHLRIVFPNLSAIHPRLPAEVQALISPADAGEYDSHLNRARAVVDRATHGDGQLRRRLTMSLAEAALRERWPHILADIATDAGENLAATLSFYTRLVTSRLATPSTFHRWFHSDGTVWIYERLSHHDPTLSRAFLTLASALGLAAIVAVVANGGASLRGYACGRFGSDTATTAMSVLLLFCLLNGVGFAASQDLVQIRYTLVSHLAMLLLLYPALVSVALRTSDGSAT